MYFCYFIIIFPLERAGPFIWTNLNPLYRSMHCANLVGIVPMVLENFLFNFVNVFLLFHNCLPLEKDRVNHFNKLASPFTQGCIRPRLVEIGPEVLEKIFKFCQCIFANLLFSPLGKGRALLNIWTNLNPLHPRMLCAKFGWNWSSSSGEEDENVTFLQTNGQMDQQMDDQKSSFELSAQVS